MTRRAIVEALASVAGRTWCAITDDGRHPDNAVLLLVLALVIGAAAAGWLD